MQTGLAVAFGFFAALFLVLLIAPAVARRISELTWRQATRVLPQSSEEIAAGRDHIRGLNAIDLRKLEMKLEAVSEKERVLRVGKQAFEDQISKLTEDAAQLKNELATLQIESNELSRNLQTATNSNALMATEIADRDVRLVGLGTDFTKMRSDHQRLTNAFASLEEARQLSDQKLELIRNEAATLRNKLISAESELRIARNESRRHDNDAKLANRKVLTLETKLERSIRSVAEIEEKLDRREAELKRLKDS
ncbi:MAG: hypothetical protein ACRCT6_03545, partial [Notoacmeibacter sp.]